MFLDEEGTRRTPQNPYDQSRPTSLDHEGEDEEDEVPLPYTNEHEKQLHSFLSNNNLLTLYDKLKSFKLYLAELQMINLDRQEFDDLCGDTCLQLTGKPHIKLRLKTAIQSLQNEQRFPDCIAPPNPIASSQQHQPIMPIQSSISSTSRSPQQQNQADSHIQARHHYYPPPSLIASSRQQPLIQSSISSTSPHPHPPHQQQHQAQQAVPGDNEHYYPPPITALPEAPPIQRYRSIPGGADDDESNDADHRKRADHKIADQLASSDDDDDDEPPHGLLPIIGDASFSKDNKPTEDDRDDDDDDGKDGDDDGEGELLPIIGRGDFDGNNMYKRRKRGHAVVPGENDHAYPSPVPDDAAYSRHGEQDDENEVNQALNYVHHLEEDDGNEPPLLIEEKIDQSWKVMIFLRVILFVMDSWIIQPALKTKSIVIGGRFGSFLLFVMSMNGMYNICKNPFNEKSGSLSIVLAASEVFYFVARDALSNICYQDLYPWDNKSSRHLQLYNFVVSVILGCCLGRIVWQYRSEIFAQIHASKWNVLCNYLMYAWVVSWEINALDGIVYGGGGDDGDRNEEELIMSPKVEKIHNLLNVFFCTENAFLLGVIMLAPPVRLHHD